MQERIWKREHPLDTSLELAGNGYQPTLKNWERRSPSGGATSAVTAGQTAAELLYSLDLSDKVTGTPIFR